MARRTNKLSAEDVVQIMNDEEILDSIVVKWDEDGNMVVKATWLVPDQDGTMRFHSRVSGANATGFVNAVFENTKTT